MEQPERSTLLDEPGEGSSFQTRHYAYDQNPNERAPLLPKRPRSEIIESSHRGSGWTVGIIVFLLLTFIGCSILALYFLPNGAQRVMREGLELSFTGANIGEVGERGFQVRVSGSIGLNTSHDGIAGWSRVLTWLVPTVRVKSSALEVLDNSTLVLGHFPVPEIKVEMQNVTNFFNVSSPFTVQDENALALFVQELIHQKEVVRTVRGPLTADTWLASFREVQVEKEVAFEGLNGLPNVTIEDVKFTGEHPKGGIAMQATAVIFNQDSKLGISAGPVDFSIHLPDEDGIVKIGMLHTKDFRLVAGQASRIDLEGRVLSIENPDDERTSRAVSNFVARWMRGLENIVVVKGDPHPQTAMPQWLRVALSSISLEVTFPGRGKY
ncbi:uncharacterized protein VTP21DRAFT_9985 [Calcarisporiella thermophila]|uniref:uncharacterized protein n=1 Tax=Calcarisporiella thermophila TaxID=911321 RepID=UPI0037437CF9